MSTYDVVIKACSDIEKGLDEYAQRNDEKFRELSDQILEIKQRGALNRETPVSVKSAGDMVAEAMTKNIETFERNRSMKLSVKASVLSSQVGMVAHQAPVARPSGIQTSLISAIPTRSIGGAASLMYSRITDNGSLGAVQNGEGAQKVQVQPTFTPITQNAITVAGWSSLSEQALKTQGELSSVINSHLSNQILRAVDNLLIDGTAVTAWPFAGYEALASSYISATYTLLHDAIIDATANMRAAGYEPDVVCMNPMTFLDIALKKDTAGQYLTGAYMGELPARLHGMRVTFSSSVALGKALVLDTRFVEMLVSDDLNVVFAYNADDFVKNLVTVRAEIAVIPVVRDLSALSLVSPKP